MHKGCVPLIVTIFLMSLVVMVTVKGEESNQPLVFTSGVTLYSPLNTTYASNVVYCNGSFSSPNIFLSSLNYSIDGEYKGNLMWKFNLDSLGTSVTVLGGSVPLPNLADGSHKLSIGVKEELWDGTTFINETTWVHTVYFNVNLPSPTLTPTSTPTVTPTVSEFPFLVILPLLIAILPFVIVKLFRKRK